MITFPAQGKLELKLFSKSYKYYFKLQKEKVNKGKCTHSVFKKIHK